MSNIFFPPGSFEVTLIFRQVIDGVTQFFRQVTRIFRQVTRIFRQVTRIFRHVVSRVTCFFRQLAQEIRTKTQF